MPGKRRKEFVAQDVFVRGASVDGGVLAPTWEVLLADATRRQLTPTERGKLRALARYATKALAAADCGRLLKDGPPPLHDVPASVASPAPVPPRPLPAPLPVAPAPVAVREETWTPEWWDARMSRNPHAVRLLDMMRERRSGA